MCVFQTKASPVVDVCFASIARLHVLMKREPQSAEVLFYLTGSHTAVKVSQVHLLLLALFTLFDRMIRLFTSCLHCFHAPPKSGTLHIWPFL